jgi:hypothetical protein
MSGPTALPVGLPAGFDRFQQRALLAGIAGLLLCAVGLAVSPDQFFRSYLLGYVFWIGISLGGLAIVMLHHLTGGAWGFLIRRPLESASRVLPVMALLFLPLTFGLTHLYVWARPEAVAGDPILQHKEPYLNVPFFLGRAVLYFAAWTFLAYFLNKWSLDQERPDVLQAPRRFRLLAAPGLLIYGLTVTFASFDWLMSLDPHWFSAIFGVLIMGGQVLSALAFAVAVVFLLSAVEPISRVIAPSHMHDLGKLMLAFVMLWAYFAFSQFLIIWSANLPEEIPWYLERLQGGWQFVGLLLVVGHFALPFLLLLSRDLKRNASMLAKVAVGVLAMRVVEGFWLIAPTFHHSLAVHWLDIVAPVGIGGIWLWAFAWQLKGRPLLPAHDPYFEEAFTHGTRH